MIDKIKKFTVDDKNNLLSKTFYVLPDNPSDKHFSPSQIRKKGYEGYLVLFEFLNSVIDAINENVDLSNEDIEAINANITTLQSYFSNGIALKAIADKNGNDIVATYETKADASSKLANAKLYADGKVSDEATARASADADLEARKVNISDIVDGLNDTSTNKPLSANMGKVLKGMIDAITSILSSDDTFLDTLQEIVNYIKDNKSLIDSITITKVNVSDIIDNLTSEISNKPVSANQAFILKGMIDTLTAIVNTKANITYVDNSIASAISRVYKPQGTVTVDILNSLTITKEMNGYVYDISGTGTLIKGSVQVTQGDNVAIIWNEDETDWKWDKLSSIVDLSNYAEKTYVNYELSKKVNRVFNYQGDFLYGHYNGNEKVYEVQKQPGNNGIVQRTSNGNIVVPINPADNDCATSKQYVDNAIQQAITNVLTKEF